MPARLVTILLVGLLSACSFGKPSFELPDRSSPAVQREEARVAAVLAADTSGKLLLPPAVGSIECDVRLLRQVGEVDFVYAACTSGGAGFSAPLKVEGRTVTMPQDGSEYAPSVRRIFPADIAEALNADDSRYRP